MKKFRWLCLILCILLALQGIAAPAVATSEVDPTETVAEEGDGGEPAETSDPSEPSDPSDPTEPTGAVVMGPIPEVEGDASVEAGCRTIGGKVPLATNDKLLKTAKAALLYERNTGTILYALNPDTKMYPASLTKVMTCMVALENISDMNEIITVTESAIADVDPEGTTAGLKVGEEMSVENLFYCFVVESANDAGAVLAQRVAGSEEAFVELMNQRAQALGCTDTHFANTHGLHDDDHYTTARDLGRIMLAALENPLFRKFDSTAAYTVPATNKSEPRELYTTNYMLGRESIDGYYDKRVTGGKTGYTSLAGRCLMATAEDDNLSLLSVVLGAQEEVLDDGWTTVYYGNFEETEVLLDFGFDNFRQVQVTLEGQTLEQYPVSGGQNQVAGGPSAAIRAVLPNGYKESFITRQSQLTGDRLEAPVAKGQTIGRYRVWYGACCIAQADMVALSRSELQPLGEDIFVGSQLQRENLGKILKISGVVFLGVVVLLMVISLATSIRSAVIRARRRRRRRERSAARRVNRRKDGGRGR